MEAGSRTECYLFDSFAKVIAVISWLSGAEMVMKRRKNVGRKPREHRRLPFP